MMQKRKLIPLFLGFSILLQAVFFQVALPNLVLCIGEEGHVAFEWRYSTESDTHNDCQIPTLFSNNEEHHSDPSASDCTDINLHFHSSQAEMVQKKNITKYSSSLSNITKFLNPEVIKLPYFIKSIQFPLPQLNIGTEQSAVLII